MINRLIILFVLLALTTQVGYSQTIETVYRKAQDSTTNCYTIVLPDSGEIQGLIVRDYSRLPNLSSSSPYRWFSLALENRFAILYTVTSNGFPDLYFDNSGPALLDAIINEVLNKYKLPRDRIVIGGMSASGTRALRYVIYTEQGKSKHKIKVKAAFVVDAPLDLERFFTSATLNESSFKKGMLEEATLIQKVFPKRIGTPKKNKRRYIKYSVFSASHPKRSRAKRLLKVPLLMIHEPDYDWWATERGAGYFDINSYDIDGMAKFLIEKGHKNLINQPTTGKGFDKNGERKCHSWTIVDEDHLITWITKQINQ